MWFCSNTPDFQTIVFGKIIQNLEYLFADLKCIKMRVSQILRVFAKDMYLIFSVVVTLNLGVVLTIDVRLLGFFNILVLKISVSDFFFSIYTKSMRNSWGWYTVSYSFPEQSCKINTTMSSSPVLLGVRAQCLPGSGPEAVQPWQHSHCNH